MEKNSAEFLRLAAEAEPIEHKLRQIGAGNFPVSFSHVIESAQPFLVATIAEHDRRSIWVICPTVRAQELFFESLSNWNSNASFLPEAEFAAVENILPDPEIAAERLALLSQIEKENASKLVVTTRAALDQPAPSREMLRSASLEIQRGSNMAMPALLSALSGAGYERVAQVTTRGQFAVRGGIVDIFSWQTSLPLRIEFLGVRSYGDDTKSSGVVQITQDLTRPVDGDHILIVEDIVDTGLTLSYLKEQLRSRNPASIKVAALLHKPARMQREVEIDYLGFTIDDVLANDHVAAPHRRFRATKH